MGFVGHQLKKTKVGAVIVSVFDWYRESTYHPMLVPAW